MFHRIGMEVIQQLPLFAGGIRGRLDGMEVIQPGELHFFFPFLLELQMNVVRHQWNDCMLPTSRLERAVCPGCLIQVMVPG